MTKYTIWDLDNCIANDAHRMRLIDWSQTDPDLRYKAYHEACDQDPVGNASAFYRITKNTTPVFFTARPTAVREKTLKWLQDNFAIKHPTIIMRNNGDHRSSVDLKFHMMECLVEYGIAVSDVIAAYDDRQDIVDMYRRGGINASVLKIHDVCAMTPPPTTIEAAIVAARPAPASTPKTAADILGEMADTYRERNKVYGDNFRNVAPVMRALFPKGVPSELVTTDQFHLLELLVVKLSRYANSNLSHQDSIRDLAVYAAMCENCLLESKRK